MLKWHELTDGTASIQINGWQFTLWRDGSRGYYSLLSGGLISDGFLNTKDLGAAKVNAVEKICTTLTNMLFQIRGGDGKG